ncbi:hypothetical protein SE88_05640 [Helicobacter pylori]|jgi:hypothetical protein|uniref:Uncharacterized protein n=2 Tax=Helicobacter pylori TaxID=210 RepID=O25727_HELPY|nr:predicted coding region HP1097 [Helicobacter pylori 26695]AFV43903.1 hypothetical protein C695_05665 [Helicobacter pylori Rif1]AFV45495.1 hypothetical protein C730_05660 [Helicobacter pylori Rif2]AJF09328.1 hypothetical protein SE87_05640 [Helicobacter pylori 26695-1]AJF10869.1 hypothetical protein SE88_05640 [Helicobacter pylori]OUC11264.1 hypothetical protein X568_01525 [Helicobacter pylori SS1]
MALKSALLGVRRILGEVLGENNFKILPIPLR